MYSGKVSSTCFACDTRHVTLVTNPWQIMNEERTGLWLRKTGGKNITRIYIFHKSMWRLTDYYIVHALLNVKIDRLLHCSCTPQCLSTQKSKWMVNDRRRIISFSFQCLWQVLKMRKSLEIDCYLSNEEFR